MMHIVFQNYPNVLQIAHHMLHYEIKYFVNVKWTLRINVCFHIITGPN